MPKAYRRGYAVAILIGLEAEGAFVWQVFSQVVKRQQVIPVPGNRADSKLLYMFHESIINSIRPNLKEGVRSIVIASPLKTSYAQEFQFHVKSHQTWLTKGPNKAAFSTVTGSANTPQAVAALAKTETFKQLINNTTAQETEDLLEVLEKRLNGSGNLVLFSLQETESFVLSSSPPGKPKPEYILLTNDYLECSRQKNRIQRLLQIAKNKGIKTRIINAESTAGKRLTQLGGLVCLAQLG